MVISRGDKPMMSLQMGHASKSNRSLVIGGLKCRLRAQATLSDNTTTEAQLPPTATPPGLSFPRYQLNPESPACAQAESAAMDEQQQPSSLAAAFPAPPPFWQSFTPENLTQITSLRAAQSLVSTKTDPAKELPIRLLDLPAELRCLQPPEPPAEGIYRCFGALYNVSWRLKGEYTLERKAVAMEY